MTQPIVIVGAGPTGLTAAVVLARSGVPVRIVAASSGPTEESRALLVHARTLELWHKLGLAAPALERGQVLRQAYVMAAGRPFARPLLDFSLGGTDVTPFSSLVLEQSKTEGLLLTALTAAGVTVEWDTRLVDLAQDLDGAEVTLRGPRGTEVVRAPWLIGADGAGSTVRKALDLAFEGSTYPHQFFLADVDLRWAHGHDRAWLDLTADGMFSFFPLAGSERHFRVIGSLTPELAAKAEGPGLTLDDVRRTVVEHGGVDAALDDARWIAVYRLHHRRAERFRVGRVFLAGDSAHVHSPIGGQGMNTGIGDAFNLGWKLAQVATGAAPPALLDSYEAERMPVADTILGGTDRGFTLEISPNPALVWLRLTVLPRLSRLLALANPLIFKVINQTWITYRDSAVVTDAGPRRGPIRAGDRAPWAHLPDGTDLYDLLVGTGSHLLVLPSADPASPEVVEGARSAAAEAPHPVTVHVLPATAVQVRRRYGVPARTSALVLVRPDGHIGLRSQPADLDLLRRHLTPAASPRQRSELRR